MKLQLRALCILILLACCRLTWADGISWPSNQLLPTFPAPAATLDCIDVSSASGAELDLFASLEGIVNRTQPRIVCVTTADGEGEFAWINIHNLPYSLINGYTAIQKYQTNLTGLVVTDPAMPDTLNLATTIAGVSNALICNPSLLVTLTNAPYNLPVIDDLRGRFTTKYQVYGYLYTNYWPLCTHRIIAGMETNLDGQLRDYLVAMKVATVWLDPGTLNFQDQSTLGLFLSGMTAANGVYIGWWPSEGNGLGWIAQYGIPVLASDFLRNASVFGGVSRPINVPPIPPPPPLQNKVYVSLILSDGDNIQYMQHAMKINWNNSARGSIPIGWTVSPLAADADPGMLNYYWSTASKNDCLISGPSGAGYAHAENWSGANLAALAKLSNPYLQRTGLKVITVWDQVTTGAALAYATNCPTLLGLTDQSGGAYTSVRNGLCTIGLAAAYSSSTNAIISSITNAAASWNGTAPLFVAAQAVVWNLGPTDLRNIVNSLDPNKYVFVRPDHLFLLFNRVTGSPQATTEPATLISASSATLQGMVLPNATNATAWLEWGTNLNYGAKAGQASVAGTTLTEISGTAGGLLPRVLYHYRVAASNLLGVAYGADQTFAVGGRLKAWGDGSLGQTNLPAGQSNIVAIACGASHGLALKSDGTIVAWGNNQTGQATVPSGLGSVVQVAGGIQHSLALKSDGTVTAWGNNSFGQTNVPPGLTNVTALAAGGYHSLAVKADGTVTAWGFNNFGQTNVPAGLSNVVAVAAGQYHSLALKSDGTVTAWGYNAYGQTNVPGGLNNVVAIAAGQYHSLALKANGLLPPNLRPAGKWVADSLSGGDGTAIGSWTDVTGGKNATQATAASQPKLYSNVLNGHRTVRFANASSQFLTVAAADSPLSGAGDFTLAVVFTTSTQGDASSSFFQNTGLLGAEQSGVVADWALCINGGQLGAGLGAGGAGCGSDLSLYGGNVADGKPHVAVCVRAGNSISLYVDGILVATQSPLCTAARGSYDFQIGAMTTTSHFFNGDIAEIQLYNRALSSGEQLTLNQLLATTYGLSGIAGAPASRWVADSLTGSDGASVSNWTDIFGGKKAAQATGGNQPKLYSNVLNGHRTVRFSSASSQYLTVAAADSPISGAGSFTMVMVFKTTTAGASSSSFYQNTGLLGAEQPGVVNDWALCLNGSQLGLGLGAGTGGCGSDLSLYGGSVVDGSPHVATYVRSGDTVTLYVDDAVVTTQSSICTAERGDYNFQIGAMTAGTLCFNGDIAEIQLYNRALSPWEIASDNEILAATYGVKGAAGTVVVWGNNNLGQSTAQPGLTNETAAACGNDFNLLLNPNGVITGWGNNNAGQTAALPGLTNATLIAAGAAFGVALANQTPLASSATISGYQNLDLTLTLPGSDPDGNPFNFRVLSPPTAGTLYQYAAGTRGPAINGPNTLVTDSLGRLIFAPVTGATGTPYDNFTFLTQDAYYSSGTAQVTVNIAAPAVPQFGNVLWDSVNGTFDLTFSGSSNAVYNLLASTNLIDWIAIGAAVENSPGQYQFLDSSVTNSPQRFYKVTTP